MRYRFEQFILDTDQKTLLDGSDIVKMEPQVFDLLTLLIEQAGQLVTKDEIIRSVWGGRIVSESAISARINAARKALGDDGKQQRFIQTRSRRGLVFVSRVLAEEIAPQNAQSSATSPIEQTIRYTQSKDGTNIAYALSGTGPPLLRAGHFLTHLEAEIENPVWRPFLHYLTEHHSLVRYDQRGTGLSDRTLRATDLADFVADMLAVADAAGLETFPIFAASQGVPIAINFATLYPDRVSKMVLYGGYARGRSLRERKPVGETHDIMTSLMREGWGQPGTAYMTAFTSLFCPHATREEIDSLVTMQLASSSAENAIRIRNAIDLFDVSAMLEDMHIPTLIIHAKDDSVHPFGQAVELAAGLANSELRQLKSSNHVFLPSDKETRILMEAITAFLTNGSGG